MTLPPDHIFHRCRALLHKYEGEGYQVTWFIMGQRDWMDLLTMPSQTTLWLLEQPWQRNPFGKSPKLFGVHIALVGLERYLECTLRTPDMPEEAVL